MRPTRAAIRLALQQSNGSVGHAGELLGMSRATLWRKRKRYGL
ncbi:helix-turn-helix domain-containing protein [Methylovulum sp.]